MTAHKPSTEQTSTALLAAGRALHTDPARAESMVREILESTPGHPGARLLWAAALRAQQQFPEALAILTALANERPGWAGAHFQLGVVLGDLGRHQDAVVSLDTVRRLAPELPGLWRALGDQQYALHDTAAAEAAYTRHLQAGAREPLLQEAELAMRACEWRRAEELLQSHLAANAHDVLATMLLADIDLALGRMNPAAAKFEEVIERVPSHLPARLGHATVHIRSQHFTLALAELDDLIERVPENLDVLSLRATALSQIGNSQQALACYARMLQINSNDAVVWMCYGHILRTLGRRDDSIAAYRRCTALRSTFGEAYWSLANLKTYHFDSDELSRMTCALADASAAPVDRAHLHFAIARAYEDARAPAPAFEHYARGNALWRTLNPYDPGQIVEFTRRCKAVFTPGLFQALAAGGDPSDEPIFIVGMPRSGSTLIEQVLASHSEIEGTMELVDILALASGLGTDERGVESGAYPAVLATMEPGQFRGLGAEFIERTRVHRKLGRRFFIDKMPNNFLHCGLINLILPNARIIDVRRHPLACCWSNFKQHFSRGQGFAYDLADLGTYYRNYVELMSHYDAVLPGRIHHVIYEQLVANPEAEIRLLLDYCRVPFQEQCLRFHENERAVWTPSSEQVRQPVYASELESWRPYERWLEPLKAALGAVLEDYPAAPLF